jgi:mono/diheme cytochrome c family protein
MKSHLPLLLALTSLLPALSSAADDLNAKVLTLFKDKCADCHSEGDEEPKLTEGTDLTALLGDETYVNKTEPEKGELLRRALLPDNSPKRMPKSTKSKPEAPLTAEEKALLLAWASGAKATPPSTSASASPAPAAASSATAAAPSGSLDAAVQLIFESKCAECHGESKRKPSLHARVNLDSLVNKEVVELGRPEASLLFQRISLPADDESLMPPADKPQLTKEEVATIQKWIKGEDRQDAPRQFISLETSLQRIHDDLMAQPEQQRRHLRYLKLTNLYNARLAGGKNTDSDAQMEVYRAGLSKLLNSLSWKGKVTVPAAIDAERTIYRIDLRDYAWEEKIWDLVVSYYPYGIQGASARLENNIRKETHTERAYLRADWFVFATSQEPLYHTILGLPETEFGPNGLETKLGFDSMKNLQRREAVRAAFSPSGVSRTNRLIERHSIRDGGYWKSYDFKLVGAGDAQDLTLAPLGPKEANLASKSEAIFQHDGGEIIFNLPNGLQAYYLSTAKGDFLATAPPEVVEDRSGFRRTNIILNGISCITCHSRGLNAPPMQTVETLTDTLGPQAAELLGFEEKRVLEKLYVPAEELRRVAMEDHLRFQKAAAEAMPGYTGTTEPVGALYSRFNADVPAAQFASEFYISGEDLVKVLKDSEDKRLVVFAGKLEKGLPFSREEFLKAYARISAELGFTLMAGQGLFLAEFGGGSFTPTKQEPPSKLAPASAKEGELAVARFSDGSKVTLKLGAASYKIGESLAFTLHAEKACHVRVTQFGADGSTTQLLPNAHDGEITLRAGETRSFPAGAAFETAPPEGAEALMVEACTEPFTSRGTAPAGELFASVDRKNIFSVRGRVIVKPLATKAGRINGNNVSSIPADTASAHAGYLLVP